MNSVLVLSDKDGPWDVYAGKTMKHRKLPEGTTVTRYVPASGLAKVRKENRRLCKVVEWALNKNSDFPQYWRPELANRAGLRWVGKKWVKK